MILHTGPWRKREMSLDHKYTAKGKKEGTVKFIVAIACGKGIIKCHQYLDNINAEFCASFIKDHFPKMFENSANPCN